MSWWSKKKYTLAEDTDRYLRALIELKLLTTADIADSIEKLHNETRRIKRGGVSMWNYKEVLPRIFDVVDGAFVTFEALIEKIREMEARLDALEKEKKDVPLKVENIEK